MGRAIVLLMGSTTYVATRSGSTFEHIDDPPGLGVSDSGDVLSGIVAALAAQEWGCFALPLGHLTACLSSQAVPENHGADRLSSRRNARRPPRTVASALKVQAEVMPFGGTLR